MEASSHEEGNTPGEPQPVAFKSRSSGGRWSGLAGDGVWRGALKSPLLRVQTAQFDPFESARGASNGAAFWGSSGEIRRQAMPAVRYGQDRLPLVAFETWSRWLVSPFYAFFPVWHMEEATSDSVSSIISPPK